MLDSGGNDVSVLRNGRIPWSLLDPPVPALTPGADGLVVADLLLTDGRITAIVPSGSTLSAATERDLGGGMIWPGFVDIHTHIDKGHIWPRCENPDGTFVGALQAVAADREAKWTAEDVARRMEFSLRCAEAHGTVALRTHLDSVGRQRDISWPVFAEMRRRWQGRIALQAVSLVPLEDYAGAAGEALADIVAATDGGVLGAVTLMANDIDKMLDRVIALAAERSLDLDFHVDETGDPAAASLRQIAQAVLRNRFTGKVLCGHCCSLSTQDAPTAAETIALAAAAGLAVVSLPMCNLYLQDRAKGRTPRWRGVAPIHELESAGVPVMFASDNTRDPFYAYGDLDMLEVAVQAVRIAHLDYPLTCWLPAFSRRPADHMRLADVGRIGIGRQADLVCFAARSLNELFARPNMPRTVLRRGVPIAAIPPSYEELDGLMGK